MHNAIEVQRNSELGRYATVSRNIKAGELLFDEQPFVIGPKPQTRVVCLGCCSPLKCGPDQSRCSKCDWPLCSDSCSFRELHQRECDLFVAKKVRFIEPPVDSDEFCMQLDCITPLRFLNIVLLLAIISSSTITKCLFSKCNQNVKHSKHFQVNYK